MKQAMLYKSPVKSLFMVVLAITLLTSCDQGFTDMNVNPTQADTIDPSFLFTAQQLRTSGDIHEKWRAMLIYSSTLIQHLAALPTYWTGDKYLYNPEYSGAYFERAYPDQVKGIVDLIRILEEDPEDVNLLAASRIFRVFIFGRLTDLYGDVPYFQAGLGYHEGVYEPPYDPQREIYLDMLNELQEAAASFDPSLPTFGSADLMYSGDIEQWRRWAYSLMLRHGMRMSEVEPELAQEWVQRAIAGGVMQSNADVAFIPHTDGPAGINENGIGQTFASDASPRLSQTFVDFMQERNDPRLPVFGWIPPANETIGGSTDPALQRGLPNGYDANTITNFDPEFATPGRINFYTEPNKSTVGRRDSPMIFQTYAEVEFLLAEAALRGWHTGDAQTHYENGVRAALSYLDIYPGDAEISSAEIEAYLANVPWDAADGMRLIHEQYWAVTFLNEYEAWANWRRTGYPELTPVNYPGNVTGGTIPRRLRYPAAEAVQNPTGYQQAISRQGPDEFTTRMWWDVN